MDGPLPPFLAHLNGKAIKKTFFVASISTNLPPWVRPCGFFSRFLPSSSSCKLDERKLMSASSLKKDQL